MHAIQTGCGVCRLKKSITSDGDCWEGGGSSELTNYTRMTPPCIWFKIYSLIFPVYIHSGVVAQYSLIPNLHREMEEYSGVVGGSRERLLYKTSMVGSVRRYSLQRDWDRRTLGHIPRSLAGCNRTTLIAIRRPRSSSLNTFVRPT